MRFLSLLRRLGPGVITGASDDDPSGIAIYSQAGARAGYSLLWTAPFLTPFMIAIQEISARIGMVTGHGLIGTMRKHYPPMLLWIVAASIFAVNTVNIGADLAAMAATTKLLFPINLHLAAFLYGAVILISLFKFSYKTVAKVLKWLTLSLFAYVLATLVSQPGWREIFKNTVIPNISFDHETLLLLVAIIGTTISPYLFFWQASEEVEEEEAGGQIDHRRKMQIVSKGRIVAMKGDVTAGMIFSNIAMYFVIATAASTLFRAGIAEIQTAEQAASALRPLAGDASYLLFTLGIVGTGLLAIPVLAGSAAYAVSETFGSKGASLSLPFSKSKTFYLVILLSTITGLAFTLFDFSPFRALFLTGVLYGVLSPFLILIILNIANRKDIMGSYTNGVISNIFGGAIFVLMSLAAVGAFLL